jgi:hypothetical protein
VCHVCRHAIDTRFAHTIRDIVEPTQGDMIRIGKDKMELDNTQAIKQC